MLNIYHNKPKKFTLKRLGLVIATIILTSGCAERDMSDLNQFVSDTRSKYAGQVEPLPVITPYESYSYVADMKRDPFKASVALVKSAPRKRVSNGVRPSEVRNKEELERYPLSSLVMVGIMNNDGDNWAIVKAPDGSIFRVKKGNYMGENHGKITKITESQISLKEIVSDGMDGWKERNNKVTLFE